MNPAKRILLDQLPGLLAGYGKSQPDSAVVVLVDVDDRDCISFKQELLQLLKRCHPRQRVLFRLAIEEIEAWLLGDKNAIRVGFPRAKLSALKSYRQDSICGTWELLADAVYPGGSSTLKAEGWPRIGQEKCRWASRVGVRLNVEANLSPSFHVFRSGVLKLCGTEA